MRSFRFTLTGLTLAGLTATALFLACGESTTPGQPARRAGVGLSNTMASGFTSTPDGRGNAGTFHIHSKANGYDVQINAKDNTDIAVANIVVGPGGSSGWHSHPGPVLVVVKTGAITFYRARGHGDDENGDDENGDDQKGRRGRCSSIVHPAGTAFIEIGDDVGEARNEGSVDATATATYFAPAIPPGSPSNLRIDQPAPGGNCPS